MHVLVQLVLLGLASGVLAITMAKGKIFTFYREAVGTFSKFLYVLVNCTFCTSWWTSAALYIMVHPMVVENEVANAFVCVPLIVLGAALSSFSIFFLHANIPAND